MSYWERLKASTRQLKGMRYKGMRYYDAVKVVVWYDLAREPGNYHAIYGRAKAQEFLARHSSFAEVSRSRNLPDTIDHINCVNDEGITLEEFYVDGPSLNERELAEQDRNQ